MTEAFRGQMAAGYGFDGPRIHLGRPMAAPGAEPPDTAVDVALPLGFLNRHGLIAGATGTGKTRTLQLIAEQASAAGCPVFAADVKGDLAGIGAPGEASEGVTARASELAHEWEPAGCPVELLSLTGANGVPLRATVTAFGPTLLAKVLGLNETQESSLFLVFRFCDEKGLPLVDLEDLRAALAYLTGPGKAELKAIGGISTATAGVLLRQVSRLEAEGGDAFFGEPEMEIADLIRTAPDGRGIVSVLDLADMGERPALFSTFLMWVLAELFDALPEVGDPEKPVLVFFFDEAHLLFDEASDAFLEAVARTVRLIRSKGVGVFFITQLPTDLPDEVLAQLGHRVQHAVRAFTPKDARALKQAVETFPTTEHYDLAETLQALGVGEAAVTALDPRGVPTPVAATRLYPPASRMAPLTPEERAAAIAASPLRPALRRSPRPRERRRAARGPHGRRRREGRGGARAGDARPPAAARAAARGRVPRRRGSGHARLDPRPHRGARGDPRHLRGAPEAVVRRLLAGLRCDGRVGQPERPARPPVARVRDRPPDQHGGLAEQGGARRVALCAHRCLLRPASAGRARAYRAGPAASASGPRGTSARSSAARGAGRDPRRAARGASRRPPPGARRVRTAARPRAGAPARRRNRGAHEAAAARSGGPGDRPAPAGARP